MPHVADLFMTPPQPPRDPIMLALGNLSPGLGGLQHFSPCSAKFSPASIFVSPSFPIVLGRTKAQNKQDDTRVNPAKLKNTLEMDILCNTKAVAKFPQALPLIKLDQNRPDQRPRFEGVVLAVNKLPWLTHNNPAPPPNTADVANCNQSNVDDGPNEHATRKGA